jgi:predicted lactoylglutathione lyase
MPKGPLETVAEVRRLLAAVRDSEVLEEGVKAFERTSRTTGIAEPAAQCLAMTAGYAPFQPQNNSKSDVGPASASSSLARTTREKEPIMAKMIFVNLPVTDLARATAFYQAIGATKNEQFSDETASCMVFSETIHVMLLTHDKYRQFTPKKIADARTSSQVLICLSSDSREAVDDMVAKAQAEGGGIDPGPKQDYGFMYGRSFEDPDGHHWEVMWMDVVAAQSAMAKA